MTSWASSTNDGAHHEDLTKSETSPYNSLRTGFFLFLSFFELFVDHHLVSRPRLAPLNGQLYSPCVLCFIDYHQQNIVPFGRGLQDDHCHPIRVLRGAFVVFEPIFVDFRPCFVGHKSWYLLPPVHHHYPSPFGRLLSITSQLGY